MANVQRICTRAILLDHGEIVEDDSPQKVIRTYSQRNAQVDVDATCVDERNGAVPTPTYESDLAQIIAGHIVDRDGAKQNQVKYRDEVIFSLRVDVYETLEHVIMELLFVPVNMGGIVARTRQFELLEGVRRGSYFATIRCEGMNLAPGVYSVNAVVYDENTVLSMVEDVYRLVIVPGDTGLSSNTAGFFEFDGELRLSKA
jgi:hypothetical protein